MIFQNIVTRLTYQSGASVLLCKVVPMTEFATVFLVMVTLLFLRFVHGIRSDQHIFQTLVKIKAQVKHIVHS